MGKRMTKTAKTKKTGRPTKYMQDLGSRPERRASPEADIPCFSARRSMARQMSACFSICPLPSVQSIASRGAQMWQEKSVIIRKRYYL